MYLSYNIHPLYPSHFAFNQLQVSLCAHFDVGKHTPTTALHLFSGLIIIIMPALDVTTEMLFLERSDVFDTEKPYTLQYEPDPGFLRTNCNRVPTGGIQVTDIRGKEHEFSKEKNGFEVLQMESKLSLEDFYDSATVQQVYYQELKELLRKRFGAKRVEVLEHSVINPLDFPSTRPNL